MRRPLSIKNGSKTKLARVEEVETVLLLYLTTRRRDKCVRLPLQLTLSNFMETSIKLCENWRSTTSCFPKFSYLLIRWTVGPFWRIYRATFQFSVQVWETLCKYSGTSYPLQKKNHNWRKKCYPQKTILRVVSLASSNLKQILKNDNLLRKVQRIDKFSKSVRTCISLSIYTSTPLSTRVDRKLTFI